MNTTTPDAPASTVLDLTGLPEPFVRRLRQLVSDLRATVPTPAPQTPRLRLRGSCSQPAPDYTPEMMRQDRLEAWAGFPKDLPVTSGT